ncbi:MAG: DUF4411 family protein [Phycisphaerales bacterium]
MIYSLDTNFFIGAWRRTYPRDVFPTFWEKFEALLPAGVVIVSEEVQIELGKKEDDLSAWLKARKNVLRATDEEVQSKLRELLARDSAIAQANATKHRADPFVIAVAMAVGGTVVTEELRGERPGKRKIPDACEAAKVPCIGPVEFLRACKIVV